MPTRNVNLTDHYDAFINAEVASGKYANASEVVRAGLRLLEQQKREDEEKISRLRELVAEGVADIEAGSVTQLKGTEEIKEFVDEIGRRVRERAIDSHTIGAE